MTHLRVCDACSRHVFATETHCPFCATPLAPVRRVLRFKLGPGMSRAQRFALAGAIAGLIGCQSSDADDKAAGEGGSTAGTGSGANVGQGGNGGMNTIAFYGNASPPIHTPPPIMGTGGVAAPTDVDAGADDAGDEHA